MGVDSAISSRNTVIAELQEQLASAIEDREAMQNEYTQQANQLAEQIQSLQQQLKQAIVVFLFSLWNLMLLLNNPR
jgi:FMN-dependent NADH-azoreductase